MKILFLDHDGVICLPSEWGKRHKSKEGLESRLDPFNKKAIKVLNNIILKTDAEIIVSSDWKYHATLEELGLWYEKNGIIKKPIDVTPYLIPYIPDGFIWEYNYKYEQIRHLEILNWLKDTDKNIKKWVAVDDMDLSGEYSTNKWGLINFVRTPRMNEGIKQTGIENKIIEFLTD